MELVQAPPAPTFLVPMLSSLDPAQFLPGLALATAIGLLIGAERGWRLRDEEPGTRVAGVRTFAILGLLGGLLGLAASLGLEIVAMLVALGAIATLLISHFVEMRSEAHVSATSAIAAIVTMLLGSLATSDQMALASVGAGVMVALLASRETLHGALGRTSQAEMTALIRLALVIFLVLPLLPDSSIGPFGGINPRRIWFVVVVIGSISFAGYILVRWQGARKGTLLMALVGALVSSTAVTIETARRIREQGAGPAERGAISIASTVMLVRVILLTVAVAPDAAVTVSGLLIPGAVVSLGFAAVETWRALGHAGNDEPTIKPPSLLVAVLFAGLVALLSFGARWAEHYYGSGSGALVIAAGGMVDVDSAIAAVGALPIKTLAPQLAALAIVVPVTFNTLLKLGLVFAIAGVRQALRSGVSLALTACAILIAAAF
jgi:uncharacterized membrane protein (DUF4010 family)